MLLEVKQEKWKSHLIFRYQSKSKKRVTENIILMAAGFAMTCHCMGFQNPEQNILMIKRWSLRECVSAVTGFYKISGKERSRENVLGHFIYCILRDWQGVDMIPCRAGLLHLCLLACGFWGESCSAAVWTYPVFAKGIKILTRDWRREFLAYAVFPVLETVTS